MHAVIFERPRTMMEKISTAYTIFIMLNSLKDSNPIMTYLQHLLFALGIDAIYRSSPPIMDLAKHNYDLDYCCELFIC
jgi:hypothetical protein